MNKKRLEYHSVANIFPMMTETELTALKNDILLNGLREPIHLFQGKIIDGRNRYVACLENGIKPKFKTFDGAENELIDFVISLNIHRRHLTTSQKACLAAELMPAIEMQTKENLSKKMTAIRKRQNEVSAKLQNLNSSQTVSKMFGVSERYVFTAKKLRNQSEFLFNDVKQGKLSLQQAEKMFKQDEVSAKLQKPEQKNAGQPPLLTIRLTANDRYKIQNMIKLLNVSEAQAENYLITEKRARKENKPLITQSKNEYKEIKVRISQAEKDKIRELAKEQNKSVSALLREMITALNGL